MMATSRAAGATDPGPAVLFGSIGAVLALVGGTWLAAKLGVAFGDPPTDVPANPLTYVIQLVVGKAAWPGVAATVSAAVLLVLLTALATLIGAGVQRWQSRDRSIDGRARHLAGRSEVRDLAPKAAAATAARLRPGGVGDDRADHGIDLGSLVNGGKDVLASWEDTLILIAGPRRMKSTCYVIPAVVNAPGPAVATSNKRDVHDATREVRAHHGRIWCFDPQQIVGVEPDFWFNPLAEVRTIDHARELASHFAMGVRSASARSDAYFDPEGESLLARLFLAAARGRGTLLDAYRWLQNPYDTTPVLQLRHAADVASADALEATSQLADKQRDGVYGTARSFVRCLENPDITRWVTPPARPLSQFDPATFASSRDTVYSLSEEGEGSAGPLVAALTQSIFNAGRRQATQSPGGRLDPPLVSVLDEAANVVRLRKLPSQYSHFGSQGLPVMTVLQSWSQGTEVWGEAGMKALWGASTVRLYGGGAAEAQWLESLSQLIGEYDRDTTSYSYDGRGSRSRSVASRRERIYSPADLASLPRGRAIGLIAGHRPLLLQARPWMDGPHAEAIEASRQLWDPNLDTTGTGPR
ncbi:type IV secretory system conjugative DNA transfer family protein [Prauserella endophytica]|uniref:Conjugal transfer protein n=1 Tax=Prauserella endophytica TaxID=1592324 RepID=A0ABY2RUV4_9PSEU|nr:type IV secretory system conjugative DNA transfer family protein [Prauserella endophytica]TKG61517.1 conjugal transfer protein [Prauserella endophytica]